MTMGDLARRLEAASDDLAEMRVGLQGQEPIPVSGRGPAAVLAEGLDAAWAGQREGLVRLTTEFAELGAGVRLAADRYAETDRHAETSLYTETDKAL